MNPSRWLTVARIVWMVMAVFVTGTFLFTLPLRVTETPSFGMESQGITQAEFLEGLEQIGVSPDGYILSQQWGNVVATFIYLGLGMFIFWRKSEDWVALLTSFVFITFIAPFGELVRFHPIWQAISDISAIANSMLLFLWFFVFPDGRFVPRWTRWVFFTLLGIQIWRIFQPDLYEQSFSIVGLLIFGGILIAQVYRYRHANHAQRQQIKWVVFGVAMGAMPLLLFFFFYSVFFSSQPSIPRAIALNFFGGLLWGLFVLELPISLTMAIFRSRLFDIDIIIRRTLQYSFLTGLLVFTYFGLIIVLQNLFFRNQQSEIIIVLSTLTIAALFNPLRIRIQNFIDRRFYRKKYNAEQALAQFAVTARDEVDMEKLTTALIGVVNETVQPEKVTIWLKPAHDNAKREA